LTYFNYLRFNSYLGQIYARRVQVFWGFWIFSKFFGERLYLLFVHRIAHYFPPICYVEDNEQLHNLIYSLCKFDHAGFVFSDTFPYD